MMEAQLVLPSYQDFDFAYLPFEHHTSYDDQEMCFYDVNDHHLSYSSLASPEESSAISSIPAMSVDEFLNLETFGEEIHVSSSMGGQEVISSEEIEGLFEWMNENGSEGNLVVEGSEWNPSSCFSTESSQGSVAHTPSMDMSSFQLLPGYEMEEDNQVILLHLLEAYGEAMENGEKELAEESVKSIGKRSDPMGNTVERVAYNMFQAREDQGEYIRQESSNNFLPAFNVLSRALPNSQFAHFTANTAIWETIPDDAGAVWIVDFDMGEGIQWPPLIEAMRGKRKPLKLTSLKSQQGWTSSSCWNFEDTKKRMVAQARQCGVKLRIEEKGIEDVCNELMRMKKRGQGVKEWVVFNCMVGLPHMGRRRTRSSVTEFLKVAEEMLAVSNDSNHKGIVILGEGEARERSSGTTCSSSSYFDSLLRHYRVLFESLEGKLPDHLAQARTAIESLFLSPLMSPEDWFQDWEDMVKGCCGCYETGIMQLEGRKLSQESFAAAAQMAIDGGGVGNSYKVKIEGIIEHEMVLQWKETPLVRVSTWM